MTDVLGEGGDTRDLPRYAPDRGQAERRAEDNHEATLALRESEEKYRALTELSAHMVWTLTPDGEITYLSQKWFDYTGLSLAVAQQTGWLSALHPEEREAIGAEFQRYLRRGEPYAMELRLRDRDGGYRWHLTRARPLKDAQGQVLKWLGVTFDIDERKQIEGRLRALQEVTADLSAAATPEAVAGVILRDGSRASGAIAGSLYQRQGEELELIGTVGYPASTVRGYERIPLDAALPLAAAARRGAAAYYSTRAARERQFPYLDQAADLPHEASAYLPLSSNGVLLGVLNLAFLERRAFEPEEQAFIQALADHAAQALERARLFAAERRARELSERLQAVTAAISGATTPAEIYDAVLLSGAGVLDAPAGASALGIRSGTLYLLRGEMLTLVGRAGFTTPLAASYPEIARSAPLPVAEAARLAAPIWIASEADFIRRYPHLEPQIRQFNGEAAASLPLVAEDHTLGVLSFTFARPLAFDADERAFLLALADQAAQALARRQAEADERFLAALSEQIRASEDADGLLGDVVRMVGGHLLAARCYVAEVFVGEDRWLVRHEYSLAPPAIAGERPLSDYHPALREALAAGQVLVVEDTRSDPASAADYAGAYAPLGLRAHITVPLRREGRWVACLAVAADAPRRWRPREVALLEAAAERMWTAVEKLRFEAGRRAYTARLQQLNAASLAINAAPSRDLVLRQITAEARALIGAHQAVTSTTSDQNWAQAVTEISLSEKYAAWRGYSAATDGSGVYALVCRTNRPMRLTQAELEAHPAWRGFGASAAKHPPMRGWLAAPLVARDGSNIGLIQLSDKYAGEFSPDDEALLVQLAQIAAVALENQALYAQEQQARALAEEASRLKDEFLATVSHELRTPLTAFLGYAQLLHRRKRDEAYVARTVEKMVHSAQAQAQLIEDLLDISRIVSGKLRIEAAPIDLAAVIRAALDTVRPALEARSLTIALELDPRAAPVVGDASRLQQVAWNLLANAVKFTPPGGHIEVRLERAGGEARLTVSDTGQGISPAFLPHVFDRFRQADGTTHRAHGGLGLGLAIVRHLVELHGGTVRAASPGEGLGATFTLLLPLAAGDGPPATAQAGPAPQAESEGCPPELAGLRVLLVDDQPDILELLHDVLAPCGAELRLCASAQEGLAALRAWRPDVLVSDIAMPGEDGYWLIRHVRALPPEQGGRVPAAALTAYVRIEDRMRVMGAGFQQYVPKPVDPAELRDVVARLARTMLSD